MNWPTWICQTECTTITVWLCKVLIRDKNNHTHILIVGPRLDSDLNLVQNARTLTQKYLELSTLFLVDQQGQIIPRNTIQDIVLVNQPAERQYQRHRICKWYTTNWKKVDTQLTNC